MDDDRYNTVEPAAELAALRQRLVEVEQNKRTATRLAHLQSVTAALLATLTADQVGTVVIEQAIPTVGAYAGGLALLDADSTELRIAHVTGYTPDVVARWRHFALDEEVPAAAAVRERASVWINSRAEWAMRFPQNEADYALSPSQALAALVLQVDDQVLGALTLSFTTQQPFDAVDRAFLETLAQQCAQALERARLFAAERQVREQAEAQQRRLRLLSEVSIALAASLDYQTTLSRIAHLMIPVLGDFCALDLLEAGRFRRVAGAYIDSAQKPLMQAMLELKDIPIDNPHTQIARALRTGAVQIVNDISEATLAAGRYEQHHLEMLQTLAPTAAMIVPLYIQDRLQGTLTCLMIDSGRRYGPEEQALAEELARMAAQAIAHAQTYQRMQEEVAHRQRIEQELRWQANLLEQTFDAIFVWEYDGPIIFWNHGAEWLYGFARQEAIGQVSHQLLKTMHSDGVDTFRTALAEVGQWEGELCHTTRDGRQLIVESRHLLMPQQDGRRYVLESNRDITARKQAEEQRLLLERKLQEVQRMESLGMLAGGIAHDFNNLLVAILGNAELALMDLPPEAPARETIAQMSTAAHRASELTRQLLAYAGKGQLIVEPLDLNRLVDEMLHLLRAAIAKNVVLHFNPAPLLPPIVADATQLRQVLMNLVVNASEAIGTKSGVILITTGRMWADQAYLAETLPSVAAAEGDFVFVEVSDTGAGMSAATQTQLFEPFFTTKFAGRGLGLAATLGIVRGHRGALKVYSEVGRGSTFKLLLPAEPMAEVPPQQAMSSTQPWQGSGLVLVADDEPEVRAVVGRMLERLGFDVLHAQDGQAAITLFRTHIESIVCVLLDMTMPHMDGAETFRQMRQLRPDVRVILMSGYSEHDATMRFAGKGLAGFLQKPFRPHELAKLLERTMERCR